LSATVPRRLISFSQAAASRCTASGTADGCSVQVRKLIENRELVARAESACRQLAPPGRGDLGVTAASLIQVRALGIDVRLGFLEGSKLRRPALPRRTSSSTNVIAAGTPSNTGT
jgi:hypothetical protein